MREFFSSAYHHPVSLHHSVFYRVYTLVFLLSIRTHKIYQALFLCVILCATLTNTNTKRAHFVCVCSRLFVYRKECVYYNKNPSNMFSFLFVLVRFCLFLSFFPLHLAPVQCDYYSHFHYFAYLRIRSLDEFGRVCVTHKHVLHHIVYTPISLYTMSENSISGF